MQRKPRTHSHRIWLGALGVVGIALLLASTRSSWLGAEPAKEGVLNAGTSTTEAERLIASRVQIGANWTTARTAAIELGFEVADEPGIDDRLLGIINGESRGFFSVSRSLLVSFYLDEDGQVTGIKCREEFTGP